MIDNALLRALMKLRVPIVIVSDKLGSDEEEDLKHSELLKAIEDSGPKVVPYPA